METCMSAKNQFTKNQLVSVNVILMLVNHLLVSDYEVHEH